MSYCTCGIECENEADQAAHAKKQNNPMNHTLTKNQPHVDPRAMLFAMWAWDRVVTTDGASVLIHAGYNIHLAEVIYFGAKPIERLELEYFKRRLLETVFPYITLFTEVNPTATNKKIVEYLVLDNEFIGVKEDDLYEIVVEWRRRHA